MLNLTHLSKQRLDVTPYRWAAVKDLFQPNDAAELASTFPTDRFKHLASYGGDKDSDYEARSLIGMGARTVSNPEGLSEAWRQLALDFLSPAYREAMGALTGVDLSAAPLEVNAFHYGPQALLGPHPDLRDKIVTHVLYFNASWNEQDGGCLTILRSADAQDVHAVIAPLVGTSAVLFRSDDSWHAVSPVVKDCHVSRRSVTATFYHPGAVSTMWPPGDTARLHDYQTPGGGMIARLWARMRSSSKT